jgi:hypothetical protein
MSKQQQDTMEQVQVESRRPEEGLIEASQFSINLELKPERIQEPTTVQAGEAPGFRLSLSGTATQPMVIDLAEPKLTIHLYGQTLPAAA